MNKLTHRLGGIILLLSLAVAGQAAEKAVNTGAIELGPDGCTLYVSQATAVRRLNVCQKQTLPDISLAAVTDGSGVHALKGMVDGTILVALGSSVARFNSNGALLALYDVPGSNCWSGITLAPGGDSFWAASPCDDTVTHFNLATGAAIRVLNVQAESFIEHVGQMSGGGTTYSTTGVQVNHGVDLHCDSSDQPDTLQIVWNGGNVFFLGHVTSVSCTGAPFNTMSGAGVGTINGTGPATVEWILVDGGQPGVEKDSVRLVVRNAVGDVVVEVSGKLQAGNHIAQ